MKKYSTGILLSVFLISISCKKSDNNKTSNTNTSNNTNSNYTYGSLSVVRPYELMRSSGSLFYAGYNMTIVSFFTPPSVQNTYGGQVKIDTIGLKYDGYEYMDTTYHISMCPTKWSVAGSGIIPSYTFTCNDSVPTYTGYLLLPDTIDKSHALQLQINGVSGADDIDVNISDGTGSATGLILQSLNATPGTNNTITISQSSLAGLASGYGSMAIYITKFNNQIFSGKKFLFMTRMEVTNNIYIH